jgi:hypothetical protein
VEVNEKIVATTNTEILALVLIFLVTWSPMYFNIALA